MMLEYTIHITTGMNLWLIAISFYFITALLRIDSKGYTPAFYLVTEIKSYFTSNGNVGAKRIALLFYLLLVCFMLYNQYLIAQKGIILPNPIYLMLLILIYNLSAGLYWLIANRKTSKAKIIFAILIIVLLEIFIFYTYKHVWHP